MTCNTFVVRGDVAEDVVVTQHDGLVDLGLSEPRPFLARVKYLDGDRLAVPYPAPHLHYNNHNINNLCVIRDIVTIAI